jgi:hypothetical protein
VRWFPKDIPNGMVNKCSVFELLPETYPALPNSVFVTASIENAFAASGDRLKEVIPTSSVYNKRKYRL